MASYKIEVSRTAEKQIRKLAKTDQVRVLRAILDLATAPRPRGCRKLRGYEDVYRIRVGTCRVLYSIDKKKVLIIILKVGKRKGVYR
jgi:mRNA interferase RelE/StbE